MPHLHSMQHMLIESYRDGIQISEENQLHSPLLRLPAEIRNRIYDFVFGERALHVVLTRPYRTQVAICAAEHVHDEHKSIIKLKEQTQKGSSLVRENYGETHSCCNQLYGKNLGLLGSCRQIYMEAALLPFKLNTFVFDQRHKVIAKVWACSLMLEQFQYVTSVVLHQKNLESNRQLDGHGWPLLDKLSIRLCHEHLDDTHFYSLSSCLAFEKRYNISATKQWMASCSKLQAHQVNVVMTVKAVNPNTLKLTGEESTAPESLEMCNEIEMLLQSETGTAVSCDCDYRATTCFNGPRQRNE